ncbi:MAG: Mpv17/PMP22 family protein [bacterium]
MSRLIVNPKLGRAIASALPLAGLFAVGAILYQYSIVFRTLFDSGRAFLNQFPRGFECLSSGVTLGAIPDYLAQRYEGKRFDWRRWIGMIVLGAVSGGILVREFYNFNISLFPGSGWQSTLKKIMVDQLAYSPLYNAFFFSITKLIKRSSLTGFAGDVWNKLVALMPINWLYWGFVLTIIYNLPPDLMVYAANLFSLTWFAFLSRMAHDR